MSDPLKNSEMEDVLSSIRRLVSEDHRPASRLPTEPRALGKLVLTPALRVPGEDLVEDLAGDMAQYEDDRDTTSVAMPEESVEDSVGVPEVADVAVTQEEIERSDTLEWVEDAAADAAADEADAEADVAWDDAGEPADVAWDDAAGSELDDAEAAEAAVEERTSHQTLEERIAELEAAVGAQAIEWEPDGSEVGGPAPEEAQFLNVQTEQPSDEGNFANKFKAAFFDPEKRANLRLADAPREAPEEDDEAVAEEGEARAEVEEEAAGVEPDIAEFDAEIEDEGAVETEAGFDEIDDEDAPGDQEAELVAEIAAAQGDDALHNPTLSFSHRAFGPASDDDEDDEDEAELIDTVAAEAEVARNAEGDVMAEDGTLADGLPDAAEDDAGFDLDDDEILDEETLREMVAQIVREELQGALGERITRNVRRLVRREVQRALTLKDFD